MSNSPSFATVIVAVITAQLYFLEGRVDASYTPAGQCLEDNSCFGKVTLDYSNVVANSPYKLIEAPFSPMFSEMNSVRITIKETSQGEYSREVESSMEGVVSPKKMTYTQKYFGNGNLEEQANDDNGNSVLFRLRILEVDINNCILYYRCQIDNPEVNVDTLYIMCPVDASVSDEDRLALKQKAADCGFSVNWLKIE